MNWLRRHIRRYIRRRPWGFFWRICIEQAVVSIAVGLLLWVVFGVPEDELDRWPVAALITFAVVIGPPIETLFFQSFPILVVRLCRGPIGVQVLISAILFGAAHLPGGVATAGSAAVGGIYLAFANVRWRVRSRRLAFWMTAGVHAFHNALAVALICIVRAWA